MKSPRCFAWICLLVLLGGLPAPLGAQANDSKDLSSLVAAQQAHPNDVFTKRAVEDAVGNGLPDSLSAPLLASLPVDAAPQPDNLGDLVVPKPYLVTQAVEPQHGQTFSKTTYLYGSSADGTMRAFCRVHYALPDDAPLAARMARLLSLAHQTLLLHTGYTPPDDQAPFDVWLCRSGIAGGEQFGRNLYFYDLDAPRSSIEWIREIVHEYSHLALPPIGGYTAPEYWANGYLGERLIVRWFQKTPGGSAEVERAWGDFSGAANFDRLLITPAQQLYLRIGPSPKWLARTDADGMRYLIGQALAVDSKYGGREIGVIFTRLPRSREAKAIDWGAAVSETTGRRTAGVRP